jgi:hypothetical protein
MISPYDGLPASAFWKTAVADRAPLDPGALYQPRFPVSRSMRIVTAGSCFAQHIGRALRNNGFNVVDAEPLPAVVPERLAHDHGYGLYSARYGNIYTSQQLSQLYEEACGRQTPALPVWERDGRFYDAQRPGLDPGGLASPEEVMAHRAHHLTRVRHAFEGADLFIFTFGLTEAWIHRESGTVYPTAPGTIAGQFDPDIFAFHNYDVIEVLAAFRSFAKRLRQVNRRLRFLVTVSPVPLTATASGQHVEVASAYSKAVLRAACGKLLAEDKALDYFPSYELITSLNNRGVYFQTNKRSVTEAGVAQAMKLFLDAHGIRPAPSASSKSDDDADEDLRCEEAILERFAK